MIRSSYIRAVSVLLVFSFALFIAMPTAVAAQTIPEFTLIGAGWGHSIGLSQYGAKGFAEQGKSGEWIASYYYPGSSIEDNADKEVRVNLDRAASSRSSWSVRPGYVDGTFLLNSTYTLEDQVWTLTPMERDGDILILLTGADGQKYGPFSSVTLVPSGNPELSQVMDKSGPFDYLYVRYRGLLKFEISSGKIKLLNYLTMDDYLYGVVPRESPASWPAAALEAQAIVARSYAYNTMSSGGIYCTTSSQVYGGHSRGFDRTAPYMHEAARSNAAVDATSGRYVKYNGSVITTYFHSSSGGHTANIEDVWLRTSMPSTKYPYYAGVPSPYEGDRSWGPVTMSGLEIGASLKARYPSSVPTGAGSSVWVTGLCLHKVDSGHVRTLDIRWSNGQVTSNFAGDSFRSALGLKSTVFSLFKIPIERIEGDTRYDTAVEIADDAYPDTAPTVVVASGEDYADALTGSALAGAAEGPLLLTPRAQMPSEVLAKLTSLSPSKVYIMGSTAAVDAAVEAQIQAALPSATIIRFSGADRYETACLAAEEVYSLASPEKAIVVNGTAWPDAVSVSALAYAKAYPVLLSKPGEVGAQTTEYLSSVKPAEVIIVGSATVVSDDVEAGIELATGGSVCRLAGANRYATAKAVADYSISVDGGGFACSEIYIATGMNFPDGLAGGVLAGLRGQPILLTRTDYVPAETEAFLAEHKAGIGTVWVFGGAATVSETGIDAIDEIINGS